MSPAAPGPRADRLARVVAGAAILVALAVLLYHAARYVFVTDDAFISFRYAKNLVDGHGLVFNPGEPPVEGYTNFLWVLLMAGGMLVGVPPERASIALGFAATVTLATVVAALAWRAVGGGARGLWAAAAACGLLAVTRSVAVWASSGLETRLFELLVVGAVLRLAVEEERGTHPGAPWASVLAGLAAWTRPEGVLYGGTILGMAALARLRRGGMPEAIASLRRALPFAAMVAAHLAFRLAYYGDWVPNTYAAKVGGRFDPALGLEYLGAFGIEYAMLAWIPLAAFGAWALVRAGAGRVAALCAAVIVPCVASVIVLGGDHFEYRPLDLLFPFLAMLAAAGLAAAGPTRVRWPLRALAWALLAALVVPIGAASHAQFPSRYRSGYPGLDARRAEAEGFLDPDRTWLYRWPPLRTLAVAHRRMLGTLTARFAGIRQEEHRLFRESVEPSGARLASLVADGTIPPDTKIATDCVGVIPYRSHLPTLDRLGLTDREVAHGAFRGDLVAHGKRALYADARRRGIDLWAYDAVHLVLDVTNPRLLLALRRAAVTETADTVYAADVGDGGWLVVHLPQGLFAARRRFPRLVFEPASEPSLRGRITTQAIAAFERSGGGVAPADPDDRLYYALLLSQAGQSSRALELFAGLRERFADRFELWWEAGTSLARLGHFAEAREALGQALALVDPQGTGQGATVAELRGEIAAVERAMARRKGAR